MKVSVFGFVAFAVAAVMAARGAFAFLQKLVEGSAARPPVLPSAQPRRARRARAVAPTPAASAPESVVPAVAPAAHLDANSLQVSRRVRSSARPQFLGRSALRQAIVAREVLGPPLSLRPPRV